jgi:protein-tyrosine phosphatase
MTAILVVCTGNVCRSPMAEGILREALRERFGDEAPVVHSAGTAGWEGSGAMVEAVAAAAERGVDISRHVARRLTPAMVRDADLTLAMAREHRDAIQEHAPDAADRTFTLKELVRALEAVPVAVGAGAGAGGDLVVARVRQAAEARRSGFEGNRWDEDVADPLGLPLESFRAIAWELDQWTKRFVAALDGPADAGLAAGA